MKPEYGLLLVLFILVAGTIGLSAWISANHVRYIMRKTRERDLAVSLGLQAAGYAAQHASMDSLVQMTRAAYGALGQLIDALVRHKAVPLDEVLPLRDRALQIGAAAGAEVARETVDIKAQVDALLAEWRKQEEAL